MIFGSAIPAPRYHLKDSFLKYVEVLHSTRSEGCLVCYVRDKTWFPIMEELYPVYRLVRHSTEDKVG